MVNNIYNKYIKLSLHIKLIIFISFLILIIYIFYFFFLLPVLKYKDEAIAKLANKNNIIKVISNVGNEIAYLKTLLPDHNKNNEDINVVFKNKANNQNIIFDIIYEHTNEIVVNIKSINFNKLLTLFIDLEINYGIIVHKIDIIKDNKINGNVLVNHLLLTRHYLADYSSTIK